MKEGKALPPLPRDLPPSNEVKPRFADLFKGIYLKRTITVWFMWICAYFMTYGLTAWAPSLFNIVYHLPVQTSLIYGLVLSGIGLGRRVADDLLDRGDRPASRCSSSVSASAACRCFPSPSSASRARSSVLISSASLLLLQLPGARPRDLHRGNLSDAAARARRRRRQRVAARGVHGGAHHGRLGVAALGAQRVFVVFGLFALMGCLVTLFFAIETRGQVLERLSPPVDETP